MDEKITTKAKIRLPMLRIGEARRRITTRKKPTLRIVKNLESVCSYLVVIEVLIFLLEFLENRC